MLILTQKPGQSVIIQPDKSLDPDTPIKELFRDGPIEVVVRKAGLNQISMYIQADLGFAILRHELISD
jgi:sRNA-binding carbon storage regulator CsrA